MIRAAMLRSKGRLVGFDCVGHAEFAEPGSDIVCSAVSALTTTIANGIVEIVSATAGVSIDEMDGIHLILAEDTGGEELDRAELLLQTLQLGLRSIEKEYPGYLKVIIREV